MWIARDKNDELWLYEEEPYRTAFNHWNSYDGDCQLINSNWFPEVSWEDEEPYELVLKSVNNKLKEK